MKKKNITLLTLALDPINALSIITIDQQDFHLQTSCRRSTVLIDCIDRLGLLINLRYTKV